MAAADNRDIAVVFTFHSCDLLLEPLEELGVSRLTLLHRVDRGESVLHLLWQLPVNNAS